jgi:hypothetical protein
MTQITEGTYRVLKQKEAERLHTQVELIKNWSKMTELEQAIAEQILTGC